MSYSPEFSKIKNGVLTYNPSKPADYYSQLNNTKYPLSSCFATSDVNMLITAGLTDWLKKVPQGMQPEDWITSLFDLPEVDAESKRLGVPTDSDRLWYSMHEFVLNRYVVGPELLPSPYVFAAYNWPIDKIIWKIIQRKPVVCGGKFTKSGHMVCAVGVVTQQLDILRITGPRDIDMKAVQDIIVDDPYGNYFSHGYRDYKGLTSGPYYDHYADHRGNDTYFPVRVFDALLSHNCLVLY
jgi:hypothetical protein